MTENTITEHVIGAAIAIHRELGPGLLENAYEQCLAYELKALGYDVQRQIRLPIVYKELKIEDAFRLDLLVEGSLIVELKTVDVLLPVHDAQLLTYLKFSRKPLGLLINFRSKLLKDGLKRMRL